MPSAESRKQLVNVKALSEADMLCDQQKKKIIVMQHTRAHYIKKGVFKKTFKSVLTGWLYPIALLSEQ